MLFSCASNKKMAHLKSENEKLLVKVDSLSNELAAKTIALYQAQKAINQLSGPKKSTTARKKIDADDHDNVTLFVHNITKYVEWQTEKNFVIAVVGDDKMYEKMLMKHYQL